MSGAVCWHPHHRIRGRHHRSSSGFKRCFNLVSTLECTRASTWLWRSRWTQRTRMTPSPPGLLSSSSAGFPESWPSSTSSPATSTVFTIQWRLSLNFRIFMYVHRRIYNSHILLLSFLFKQGRISFPWWVCWCEHQKGLFPPCYQEWTHWITMRLFLKVVFSLYYVQIF